MKYNDWLKNKNRGVCPFCCLTNEEIIKNNKNADIILSRAPYTKNHLLVIPKKHVMKMSQLSQGEKDDLDALVFGGLKNLHKKYANVSVIYREGSLRGVGKSINHAHFHLIPNLKVGPKIWNKTRSFFTEKTYQKRTKDIREELFN